MQRKTKIKRLENKYLNDPTFRIPVDRILEEQEEQQESLNILEELEAAIYLARFFIQHPKRLKHINES